MYTSSPFKTDNKVKMYKNTVITKIPLSVYSDIGALHHPLKPSHFMLETVLAWLPVTEVVLVVVAAAGTGTARGESETPSKELREALRIAGVQNNQKCEDFLMSTVARRDMFAWHV